MVQSAEVGRLASGGLFASMGFEMGSKELDLATTMVLRDTRRGQICPIPVTGDGVGGLKVVDHDGCDGCYFADGNMDCPRIDDNLTCSTGFKSLIYMPVQASEMGSNRAQYGSPMEPTFAAIDRADEIAAAAQALVDSSRELAEARAIFEEAKARYDVAHTDWYKAWRAMTAFVDSKAEMPVASVPITTAAPYVSPDDALDTVVIDMTLVRPVLRDTGSGKVSAEEATLAALDFETPMTVAKIAQKTGKGASTIGNAVIRLCGCGLIRDAFNGANGKIKAYVLNGATNPPIATPDSVEHKVIDTIKNWPGARVRFDWVAPRIHKCDSDTKWIMTIMWRAGLLERDEDGYYSVAKGVK